MNKNKFGSIGRLALALLLSAPAVGVSGVLTAAQAQVVSRIVVEGNQRVEPETVLAYMQIRPGERMDPEKIDASLKALFQTGLFSDVQILRRGNTLVVRVKENPLINRVNFEGNSEISDKDLAKEVQLRERMMLTRARVQADVDRIRAIYRRAGFYGVRVEPKIIRLPQNRVNLVFEIDEGKASKIAAIRFVGNKAFSDSKLKDVITTSESAWWKFFSSTDTYDPDRLAYDKELLRRFYLKHGFADVEIVSAEAELAPDGESFYITFVINEGPQYKIRDVEVNAGDTDLDPQQLKAIVETKPGQIYDASKVDKSIEKITIEAGKKGYAFTQVQPRIERDPETRELSVSYDIQEGPRVYIERIDIVGNTRTLDEVIRRELKLAEGDAYNRILLDRARRRLVALDYFSKVDIQEEPGSKPDRVVLVIRVQEKSTGSIHFSAGYSTSEGPIASVDFSERNLLGTGRKINLRTSLSFKRQSVDFSFTEPYFLGYNMDAGFDLFGSRTDFKDESNYRTNEGGFGLRVGFPLDDYQKLHLRYSFSVRDTSIRNASICDPASSNYSPSVCDLKGTDYISLAGVSYVYDNLDNPLDPTSGFRGQLAVDVAGLGGDIHYVKTEGAAYYFMPLFFEGVTLKLKATAGHIEGWSGDEVKVSDRFYKGGASFRGFEVAGVGPRDTTPEANAVGGKTYAIGTVEVMFPLGLPEALGLSGSVFTDFGTVFNAPGNNVQDDAKFRASVGAGVIWKSPFGPLRLDVAYAFAKAPYDKRQIVQFGVGTKF
ncbi:outer membrane protein assembly factor BamA [Thermopetrobacter sp. TC1]|uniref:outer membrane protein assembly factor BamA n=1 Tax=Thermopetrobacter sp. TC1 TaxID=1495045 RepID=UPI00056DA518|nr:outer membrane protein assembly factor BamA [Thermopetrobacter sp. TC1]